VVCTVLQRKSGNRHISETSKDRANDIGYYGGPIYRNSTMLFERHQRQVATVGGQCTSARETWQTRGAQAYKGGLEGKKVDCLIQTNIN